MTTRSITHLVPCGACCGTGRREVIDGAAMRAVRKERGLTLAALAQRVGVTKVFLSDVELGRRNPSDATLTRILRVLIGTYPERRGGE